MKHRILVCSLAAACAACESGSRGTGVERIEVGDTVTITSRGPAPVLHSDTVRLVWQSPRLGDPGSMALVGERLVVADQTRLHVLDTASGYTGTIGREGEGPGEFLNLTAVTSLGDSMLAYDARINRLSFFDPALTYIRSVTLVPLAPFVNQRRPRDVMRAWGTGFLTVRQENVHMDEPTRSALVWRDLIGDSSAVLRVWPDLHYTQLPGGVIGPVQILGPRAIIALAPDGSRVAHGDGLEYCISVERLGDSLDAWLEKVCREWERSATGDGIRRPDLSVIRDDRLRQIWEETFPVQEVPEYLPSYDALRIDYVGRLWVRTVGPELADIHPFLVGRGAEGDPARRYWDVFGVDGALEATLDLPATFDPRVIGGDRAYGFYQLPSGEVTIGVVGLGNASGTTSPAGI